MARKNFLADLGGADEASPQAPAAYPMRGASKNMIRSLDELAKQADKFLEGEAVVELDPEQIEVSFVTDRMEDDAEQYEELKQAIQERGQDTPILVRPHPTTNGRYQVVFGHRRVRVARELGRKVRAVVKPLDDRTHVIAQGQENSARANLTFIERAIFAKRLEDLGYEREVVSSALTANAASVSKMLSVTSRIPGAILNEIGPARSVGRERWVELSLLVGKASNEAKVREIISGNAFASLTSDERFNSLFVALNKGAGAVKKIAAKPPKDFWETPDKAVSAHIVSTGKAFTLSMKAKNAAKFGRFISENLGQLYEQFMSEEMKRGE